MRLDAAVRNRACTGSGCFKKQGGAMLVVAIFIIVVMTLLGLAMTRLISASSDTVIYEVYGLRALNAAQTGAQHMVAEAFALDGSTTCSGSVQRDLSAIAGLEACRFEASCAQATFTQPTGQVVYYRFSSTGTCAAGDIIASRQVAIEAKVEQ